MQFRALHNWQKTNIIYGDPITLNCHSFSFFFSHFHLALESISFHFFFIFNIEMCNWVHWSNYFNQVWEYVCSVTHSCLLSYPLSPFSPLSSSSSSKKSSSSSFSHFDSFLSDAAGSKSWSTTRNECTRTNETLSSKQFANINKNKRFFIFVTMWQSYKLKKKNS